jgi:hypothetical protein
VNIFVADIVGRAGEEQQYEDPLGATPDLPPPSVTPPRRDSPARVCIDVPIIEEVPASVEAANTGTGGLTPTTNVAGEGETTAPELNTGKPLAVEFFSLFFLFVFLNFSLKLICLVSLAVRFHYGGANAC